MSDSPSSLPMSKVAPHKPPLGEMVITLEGSHVRAGLVGVVLDNELADACKIKLIYGGATILVFNRCLSRTEQRWVPVPWKDQP